MNGETQTEILADGLISDVALIFVCWNPECEFEPTVGTVPFCDRCGGSNCGPMVDGREGRTLQPIPEHSELGLELQRSMKIIK